MCVILDASVAAKEVFASNRQRSEASEEFFKWINKGRGRLVAAGKLLEELRKTPFKVWERQARLAGRLSEVDDNKVIARTEQLKNKKEHKSDDPHVLALAQVSGARLLYVDDRDLEADFKNKKLIDNPEGKLYLTRVSVEFPNADKFTQRKKKLLRDTKCVVPKNN